MATENNIRHACVLSVYTPGDSIVKNQWIKLVFDYGIKWCTKQKTVCFSFLVEFFDTFVYKDYWNILTCNICNNMCHLKLELLVLMLYHIVLVRCSARRLPKTGHLARVQKLVHTQRISWDWDFAKIQQTVCTLLTLFDRLVLQNLKASVCSILQTDKGFTGYKFYFM